MIAKDTIDRIIDTARVEDVVGEYVHLKKRGVNLLGLCPFHNEKTPSFNVNPVRNIYKCFGCGKAGNAVTFLMEHEHFTYPDALRWLAKKYNIEIEEQLQTPEQAALRDEKESMLLLNGFAQKHFTDNLFELPEGKSIGLPYFKERGFSEVTIRKFQLGYSTESWNELTGAAISKGYSKEFLVKTGLSVAKNATQGKEEEGLFDRFRGRVMFPIHNLSGRVIAFGGRILKKDDKTAKYLNSPESEIYHKSKVLYGIYFAKKEIIQKDNCYLVEGYTDVISLHQAGIENVVASSGTALTTEQIHLVSRYTKNITILYDADPAGIKASLRGIDMILEEGLNVKVVLFPKGEDPDSYARSHSSSELEEYLRKNSKDFIVFKTNLLVEEVKDDPLRKAMLIRDVVESIAKIPDPIIRSTYTKECSALLNIEEQILIAELNKLRRLQLKKTMPEEELQAIPLELLPVRQLIADEDAENQEKEIIRLLLNYANEEIHFYEDTEDEDGRPLIKDNAFKVSRFIIDELERDNVAFSNAIYKKIFTEIAAQLQAAEQINADLLTHHSDKQISGVSISLVTSEHLLSDNWHSMHGITVLQEKNKLRDAIINPLYHLKNKHVEKLRLDNSKKIKEAFAKNEEYMHLMEFQKSLDEIKMQICKELGIDVLK